MAENKGTRSPMTVHQTQTVIEQLWLSYYNDTLFAAGLITEAQRNKMRLKIKGRAGSIQY